MTVSFLIGIFQERRERSFGILLDLIFKNQAMSSRDKDKEPQFVNDLLRTEFHKCVTT